MNVTEYLVEERARARVGITLRAKYKLERLLGVGGMAAVYAATHRNNKRFAIKVLHPELSLHADTTRRFLREGYVANSVAHPDAVAVLDDDMDEDGSAFLVMELLDGASIDRVCKSQGNRLPVAAVLAIGERLLDVLAAADAHAIVHRDIKPANLFLTRDGQVKVLDFGVARMRESGGESMTHSGVTLGTPAYMAPEQAIGHADAISGTTDVWAAGATMFALLAGRSVHEARSAPEQMVFAATKPAKPLAEIEPAIAFDVCAIVDKALAFAPSDRWESAAAMRDAVREAYRRLFPDESMEASLLALTSAVPSERSLPTANHPVAPTALAGPESQRSPKAWSVDEGTSPPLTASVGKVVAPSIPSPRLRARRRVAMMVALAVLGIGVLVMLTRARGPVAPVTAASMTEATASAFGGAAPPASATANARATPSAIGSAIGSVAPYPSAAPPRGRASAVAPSGAARTTPPPPSSAAPTTSARDSFDHE